MARQWQIIGASVCGTSHTEKAIECQDAHLAEVVSINNAEVLICIAADGAGSAKRSAEGAAIACNNFAKQIKNYLAEGNDVANISAAIAEAWLQNLQDEFAYKASAENALVKDFACTLVCAVVADKEGVFLQVGDGGIVTGNDDEKDTYCWIFWPEKGPYANITFFVTDTDAAAHLQFCNINRQLTEIALFTDGLERLALNHSQQEVFDPFFRGMFANLTGNSAKEQLNAALQNFLNSERVNERTDDDKTLVLASRNCYQ